MIEGTGVSTKDRIIGFEKDKPRGEIQKRHWERLLRVAGEANGQFPQAFLAQGIQVAQTMVRIGSEENIPLSDFLFHEPDSNMIRQMFSRERLEAHAKHGFKTIPLGPIDFWQVWLEDKDSVIYLLKALGQLVKDQRPDLKELSMNSSTGLDAVQHDPVFQGLLSHASSVLTSPDIQQVADEYKAKISDFMKQYPPQNKDKPIPPDYEDKMNTLNDTINKTVKQLAERIKDEFILYLQAHHPEEAALAETITKANIGTIFKQDDNQYYTTQVDPLKLTQIDS